MKVALPLVLIFLFPVTGSSVFHYDESIDGDIDGVGNTPVFHLELGVNSISGSSDFGTPQFPRNYDSDVFGFAIPAGTRVDLSQIVFEYEVTSVFGDLLAWGFILEIRPTGADGSSLHASVSEFGTPRSDPWHYMYKVPSFDATISPSPVSLRFNTVQDYSITDDKSPPLFSGTYWLFQGQHKVGNGDHGGSYDYTIHIPVSEVPEPSTAIFLTVSAGTLLSRRIRRHSA